MKRFSVITLVMVVLVGLLLSGCAIQPVQPVEAPEAQVSTGVVNYAENPELRFVKPYPAVEEPVVEAGEMPAVYLATSPDYVVGEYLCDHAGRQQIIRLEQDGRISRVLGPDDVIDIGYFWFEDGEFHVVSDVDAAAHESAFHVTILSDESGVFMSFEQCGGDCDNACGIEWLEGLARVESTSVRMP